MSKSVPEGWTSAELTKFCEVVGGGTPDRTVEEYWNGDIPWASPTEITSRFSKYISRTKECISRKGLERSSAKLHPAGTVLMTSRASIGYVAINTVPMATNQGFQSLRCKEHALADYIYQYVTWIRPELEKMSAGSTFSEISSSSVKKLHVTLPPLPEQQKIAAILSSVDDVIEKTRAQIDKLKDLKTGMMQELLTKGIGHTEFKDSPVGKIPAAWNTFSAQELLNKKILLRLQDGNHGSQYPRSSEFVKHGVPYIAASHISEFGEIDFSQCPHLSQDHANRLRIRPAQSGDVILTHNATVGRTAIIPDDKHEVIASTSTTYYRTDPTKLLNRYLVTYFQSTAFVSQLQAIMGQTTRNQVPITAQRELQIVLPPIDEQVAIATAIESVTIRIKMLRSKFDHLKLAKKALMQDLLTGKVRVKIDQKESVVA